MTPAFIDFDKLGFTKAAVEVISRHEGFRKRKYKDTKGIWTIGYGFNMESGTFSKEQVDRWNKDGITEDEAKYILAKHINSLILKLDRMPWVTAMNFARRLAIVDMCFNMGIGWIDRWVNTIGFIKAKNYNAAGRAIRNSLYAKQVGARAIRNAMALELGKYPLPTLGAKELLLLQGVATSNPMKNAPGNNIKK